MSRIIGAFGPQSSEIEDLAQLLSWRTACEGDRPAYVLLADDLGVSESLSYNGLAHRAALAAQQMQTFTDPGDRVLLAMENCLDAVVLFWACILAGRIPIPAPGPDKTRSRARQSRLRGIVDNADVRVAWTSPDLLDTARQDLPDLSWRVLDGQVSEAASGELMPRANSLPDASVAYLQYTSGSTSQPRGVEITHAQVLAQCEALRAGLDGDLNTARSLVWLPWFHDYGLIHGVIQPMALGMTSYVMSTRRFLLNPLRWLEAIDRHSITHSGGPNFAYEACIKALARKPAWEADLRSWREATCGAEPVQPATMRGFAQVFGRFGFDGTSLAPCYGLAEAVLGVTLRQRRQVPTACFIDLKALEQGWVKVVSASGPQVREVCGCGSALPGFELRIVDPASGRVCEPGQVGEIWVAGRSVGRGYWRQPRASTERFACTLEGEAGQELLFMRTGDLGFLRHGELFVTGRISDLIVVHGRNLYPQDLEHSTQQAHALVRPGGAIAVADTSDSPGGVLVMVECQGRPDAAQVQEIRTAVQRAVAQDHEIGVKSVIVLRPGSIPRTSSGKPMRGQAQRMLQRGELDDRVFDTGETADEPVPLSVPETVRGAVFDAWCEVLGVSVANPQDDFLDMGGDSLMATQLVSRLAQRLHVDISIGTVFELRRLSALTERVAALSLCARDAHEAVPDCTTATRSDGTAQLSFSQERMWFMHQIAPESSAYHIPVAVRLTGRVDTGALQQALLQVVRRHDILRTRFVMTDDGVMSEVLPHMDVLLDVQEQACTEPELQERLSAFSQKPFDLELGPLCRARLWQLGSEESVLVIVIHHLVGDQWSFALLFRELATGYSAALCQQMPALPALPMQYADYACWHRQWFDRNRRQPELAYWTRQLAGLEPLSLNEDHPRPLRPSFRGASVRLDLSRESFGRLAEMGSRYGASLSMVCLAALNVLLHRHTGREDLAIGMPIANRNQLASEHLLGTFVNTLVLRIDLSGQTTFGQVLQRVRDRSLEAFAHQDMPFEVLVRELDVHHDTSRSPLFNVMFNMVNVPTRGIDFRGLAWERVGFDRQATQFDLSVLVDPQHDPGIVFEYATDLFERETIERLAGHLQLILEAAAQTPEQPLHGLSLLTTAERDQLRRWSDGREHPMPYPNVGAWLAAGLAQKPDGLALVADGQELLSGELAQRVEGLVQRLRQAGMGPGDRVGVCMPRCPDLVVALVALLTVGSAYVPLDPSYPPDRLAYQIEDAGVALTLVTRSSFNEVTQRFPGPVWVLDDPVRAEPDAGMAGAPAPFKRAPGLDDPAYLIYTSGSTGLPKGVVVPHRALLNFLLSMAERPGMSSNDRLLAVTTVSFDIAALELLAPLGCGGTVVLASQTQAMDGRELAALIHRHAVNVMQATPSRWHLLLDSGWSGAPGFKALVGGEPLGRGLAQQLSLRCDEVWNMYGPTETTVWSTCWRVDAQAPGGIALGGPIANTSVYVLDTGGLPCPIGVIGEICIGGQGLALGYHQRPDLTQDRFVVLPVGPAGCPVRVYRTGDLGRWRYDGLLEHAGRMDDQIKLRGFRIELGEIEARLSSLPGVQRAVVALKSLSGSGPSLVAYLVTNGPAPGIDSVRDHLRSWLPEHMIPTQCVSIDAVPLLANGKTDRNALPMPGTGRPGDRRIELPRNHAEQLVWDAWAELLGTRHIGIHDSFFDVGGHSLLAVRLASRIGRSLGRPVALGTIFTHVTIAACAEQLMQGGDVPDLPVAVLQPVGDGIPLFLLAGADMYRSLARALPPDAPVYGLFSPTEIDLLRQGPNDSLPVISIHSLTQEYLELIRSVQERGPYRIGGFSIGGVIAFEVAKVLRAQGQEVQLLVMLDCALPGKGAGRLVRGIGRRARQMRAQGWADVLRGWRVMRDAVQRRAEPGQRRISAYARAIRNHMPGGGDPDFRVLFFQAAGDPSVEPAYGWSKLIPQVEVERVPGRHADMLEAPHVAELAARLHDLLRKLDHELPLDESTTCPSK